MTDPKSNLVDWLRNAHAMEQQAEQMLEAMASRIKHYPELRQRIEAHLEETRGQQALLDTCFERLGESPSTLKDIMGKVAAFGQAMGGAANSDEIVKGAIASYVFESLEIASYTSLLAAAEAVGDMETADVARKILPQEEAMAQWLLDHIPLITTQFLQRDAAPGTVAKK